VEDRTDLPIECASDALEIEDASLEWSDEGGSWLT